MLSQRSLILFAVCICFLAQNVFSVEYSCPATRKLNFEQEYSQAELDKWQFATKVEDTEGTAYLSRCSLSEDKVTCDRYKVDRIEYDGNVQIKKYYYFRGQFNFQIFADLSSLEDNGRGDIQFGKCEVISP